MPGVQWHEPQAAGSANESAASSNERLPSESVPNAKRHERFYLNTRSVEFVLDDDTLYRVFRRSFEAHSPVFAEKYLSGNEGLCNEPIKLTGASRIDFDRLLSLMYPDELATCPLTTPAEWISVLRLTTRWSFVALRKRAVEEVGRIGSAIDKMCAAREFGTSLRANGDIHDEIDKILQSWLLPAFTEICTAPASALSDEDAERLGLKTFASVVRIRERM
ncbi:hypothetical protein BD626DRAFT_407403, partial [Schizophyllum amplum]